MGSIPDTSWRKARGESPTRRAVRQLADEGKTARQIAEALGLSTQRIHQHLRAIREADQTQREKREAS